MASGSSLEFHLGAFVTSYRSGCVMTEPPLEASRPSEHITWWEEHQNGARLHSIFTRPQYKQLRAVIRIDTGKRRPPDVDIRRSVTQFPPPNAVVCTFGQALGCVHSQARPDYPSKTLKTIVAYSSFSIAEFNEASHYGAQHDSQPGSSNSPP